MSRMQPIIDEFRRTRLYTDELIKGFEESDWFRMPSEGVTHLAWQVGHLAVAQYALALKRVRGERSEDADLIPERYFQLFGKGSRPEADASKYPSAEEIRSVFRGVHKQTIHELSGFSEDVLDEPSDPHPMFRTKGGALKFCPQHEMMHAGQIGLLRRLLGYDPLR